MGRNEIEDRIDMDGVLADFNPSYIRLLNEISGTVDLASESYQPTQWNYEGDLGFTNEHVLEAWEQISVRITSG
jgi:phosphoglycolate phosphatase-like HAD superfamily hydrolase